MAAPRGDDVHWHALVEQQGFVAAAKVVEPQLRKAKLSGAVLEIPCHGMRVTELGEIRPVATWEHQGIVRQAYKR
jgi:hypothetical protein